MTTTTKAQLPATAAASGSRSPAAAFGAATIPSQISFQDDGPSLTATSLAMHGLDFGSFVPNNNEWGTGSGTATGSTGSWTISNSADGQGGSGAVQLERVGDAA